MDWNGDCNESNNKSLIIDDSENDGSLGVILFPNPNNGNFKLIADSKISFIKVFNVNGSLIKEFKNVFSTELDFSLSLDAGIYLIKIAMFNGVTSDKRLIIE
jgi:hypothetical protein